MVEPRPFGLTRVAGRLLIAGSIALCWMPAFLASAASPPNLWRGLRTLFWPTRPELSPTFPKPGVIKGIGEFDKSAILTVPEVGTVTHITLKPIPDARLGIAGTGGAIFVSAANEVKSRVNFSSKVTIVEFVDLEKDGVWEFLSRGGEGWNDASLLDHQGRRLGKFGEKHVLARDTLAVND